VVVGRHAVGVLRNQARPVVDGVDVVDVVDGVDGVDGGGTGASVRHLYPCGWCCRTAVAQLSHSCRTAVAQLSHSCVGVGWGCCLRSG